MRSLPLGLVMVAVVATACAQSTGGSGPSSAQMPSPPPADRVAADCEALAQQESPPVDPSTLPTEAHTPEYRGGELHQWARTQAGDHFGGLWHTGPTKGVIVMAFTERVEAYREQIHQRFSDDIRVVGVERTWAELDALKNLIEQDMRAQPRKAPSHQRRYPDPGTIRHVAISEWIGRVRIGVIGGDEAALAELSARYGADRICLDRREPIEPPDLDGPVRRLAKAEGWLDELGPETEALLEIAYDRPAAQRAWQANVPDGLERDPGEPAAPGVFATLADVDFDQEAVVAWSAYESPSCPEWLADVRTDADGTVHLDTDAAGGPACETVARPYRMVLAVDRDRLPDPTALPANDVVGVSDARVTVSP